MFKLTIVLFHFVPPELSVGMTTEGIDVRSVGNSMTLHETALVEAFNLKAAIEYQLKNCKQWLCSGKDRCWRELCSWGFGDIVCC
jgi:hypothetical protein